MNDKSNNNPTHFKYEIIPSKQVYEKYIRKCVETRNEYEFQQLNIKISKITQNSNNIKK